MTQSELGDYQDSGCIDHTDPETLRRLYYDERLSALEIAEAAEVSSTTIYNWMDRFDIDRRDATSAKLNHHNGEPANLRTRDRGYVTWESYIRDNCNSVPVHRLLAVAEYGYEAISGKHIHHKNGVKWDNRPENIEPLEPKEHHRKHSQGEKCNSSKLTREDVVEIKAEIAESDRSDIEIADDYGVTYGAIEKIRKGENWVHVG